MADVLPKPETAAQRALLQGVWDHFVVGTGWPAFEAIDRWFDSAYDGDVIEVVRSLPSGLLQPPGLDGHRGDEQIRLTPAGLAACRGAEEVLAMFVAAIRLAAELEREHTPGNLVHPRLTSKDLEKLDGLPAAGREHLVLMVGHCLGVESWGWHSYGEPTSSNQIWSFGLTRDVRRFRKIGSLEDYWRTAHPPAAPESVVEQVPSSNDADGLRPAAFSDSRSQPNVSRIQLPDAIRELLEQRIDEIDRCIDAEAYLAAVILCGSTLEGLLYAVASQDQEAYNRCSSAPKVRGAVKPLESWTLAELIVTSREIKAIGEEVVKYAHAVRGFRNYVHPRQQLKEGSGLRQRTAVMARHVLYAAIEDLGDSPTQ